MVAIDADDYDDAPPRPSFIDRLRAIRLPQWKRKVRAPDPPSVKTSQRVVDAAYALSWVSAATAAYFMWMFCVGVAGDQSSPLHVTHAGTWQGDVRFYFPLVFGFGLVSFGIPYLAKNVIPIFVSLDWVGNFWPKLWTLVLTIAASLAIIAGSFSVMGGAIIEHGRGAAVAVEQVQMGRASLQAQIDAEQAELDSMMNNRNAYMAQAANVGETQWRSQYIAQARRTGDGRLPMIERAVGAAIAADTRRTHIRDLRIQMARSGAVAAVEATPVTSTTEWIARAIDYVRGAWALILSVLNDIVCLLMGWIALRLEQARARQLAMAKGDVDVLDDGHMIEDLRDEPQIAVEPMEPQVVARDAVTGDEVVYGQVKAHMRRLTPKKRGRQVADVEIPPIELPDEAGAAARGTGDERWASEPTEKHSETVAGQGAAEPRGDDEADYADHDDYPDDDTIAALAGADDEDAPLLTDDDMALGREGRDGVMKQEMEEA